jgi:hypothetical protein
MDARRLSLLMVLSTLACTRDLASVSKLGLVVLDDGPSGDGGGLVEVDVGGSFCTSITSAVSATFDGVPMTLSGRGGPHGETFNSDCSGPALAFVVVVSGPSDGGVSVAVVTDSSKSATASVRDVIETIAVNPASALVPGQAVEVTATGPTTLALTDQISLFPNVDAGTGCCQPAPVTLSDPGVVIDGGLISLQVPQSWSTCPGAGQLLLTGDPPTVVSCSGAPGGCFARRRFRSLAAAVTVEAPADGGSEFDGGACR